MIGHRLGLFCGAGLVSIAMIYACGGDESSSSSSSSTSSTSSSGTGGSASGTGGSASGTGGSASGTGGSASGTGGSASGTGGGGPCLTCSEFLTACVQQQQCPPTDQLCQGTSQQLAADLQTCLCAGCANQCSLTCSGQGQDSPACQGCIGQALYGSCQSQANACYGDT